MIEPSLIAENTFNIKFASMLTLASQILDSLHDVDSSRAIQSTSRLIQHNNAGVRNQGQRHAQPLRLSPRNALEQHAPHSGVFTRPKPHDVYDLVHSLSFLTLRNRTRKRQVCCELDCFSHCEHVHQCVFLGHVRGFEAEVLKISIAIRF